MNRFFIFIFFSFIIVTSSLYFLSHKISKSTTKSDSPIASPSATPTASPSATPRPLTFKEMNVLYGPCVYLPTLMYHHIQPMEEAKAANHQYLNVAPETFRSQLQYIKNRGYSVVTMSDLINFFDQNTPLPPKPLLITIDDGYKDNYTYAFPILKEFSYPATIFLSTGLMQNGDYLDWSQISEMNGQRILLANHTWSHKNLQSKQDIVSKEIQLADTQLTQRGLGSPKVFAYPYGITSNQAKIELKNQNYLLAFTTVPGSTLCKKQRFDLPRVRVGNSNLSAYGL